MGPLRPSPNGDTLPRSKDTKIATCSCNSAKLRSGQLLMTFAYSLVVLSALGLVVLLLLAKGRWFARSAKIPSPADLHAIDVEAFRNLIDEDEEAYLRNHLPAREFRRVHRERMLAAVEYVRAAY